MKNFYKKGILLSFIFTFLFSLNVFASTTEIPFLGFDFVPEEFNQSLYEDMESRMPAAPVSSVRINGWRIHNGRVQVQTTVMGNGNRFVTSNISGQVNFPVSTELIGRPIVTGFIEVWDIGPARPGATVDFLIRSTSHNSPWNTMQDSGWFTLPMVF